MKFFEKIMIDEYLDEMTVSQVQKLRMKLLKSGDIYPNKKGNFVCKKCGAVYQSPKLTTVHYLKSHMGEAIDEGETLDEAPIASKGWTQASIQKFGKTIGKEPTEHGFFDACVKRMEGKKGFDNEKARGFCASIKDAAYNSPMWRGKGKSKKEIKSGTKEVQYKKKLPKGKK